MKQIDMSLMRLARKDMTSIVLYVMEHTGMEMVMKEFLGVAPRNLSDPELT